MCSDRRSGVEVDGVRPPLWPYDRTGYNEAPGTALLSSFVFFLRTRAAGRLDDDVVDEEDVEGDDEDRVGETDEEAGVDVDGDDDEGDDEERVEDTGDDEDKEDDERLGTESTLREGRAEEERGGGRESLEKSLARSSP